MYGSEMYRHGQVGKDSDLSLDLEAGGTLYPGLSCGKSDLRWGFVRKVYGTGPPSSSSPPPSPPPRSSTPPSTPSSPAAPASPSPSPSSPSSVTPDAHFYKDLGLDSLDTVEIAMALEEEFGKSATAVASHSRCSRGQGGLNLRLMPHMAPLSTAPSQPLPVPRRWMSSAIAPPSDNKMFGGVWTSIYIEINQFAAWNI